MIRGKCRGKYFNYLSVIDYAAMGLLIGKEILGKVTKKLLDPGLLQAQEDRCPVEVP